MKYDSGKIVRIVIQVFFFIMMPSLYSMSFSGVKYLFEQVGNHESIELTGFLAVLIALCLYTIIFGRFFCGYACAFGSFGEWIFELHTALNKLLHKRKPAGIPERVLRKLMLIKYILLAVIVLACYRGFYSRFHGMNPWDVFGQIRALTFGLSDYKIGMILMAIIIVLMFMHRRFFCTVLCPMGAVFTLLPILPYFTVRRNREECIKGCSACKRVCPAYLDIPDGSSVQPAGDCFECQQCTHICPKHNVHNAQGRWNVTVLTLIKAAVLFVIAYIALLCVNS